VGDSAGRPIRVHLVELEFEWQSFSGCLTCSLTHSIYYPWSGVQIKLTIKFPPVYLLVLFLVCRICGALREQESSCPPVTMANNNEERTFIMVKPDGVQRGLVGEIVSRFEKKGFKLIAMKYMWVSGPA